jgi:hypothetical protein
MALPEGELWGQPLHLADSLAGDAHYERIVRAGSALLEDLKTANENREDWPKPRPTGGFLVKDEGAPVVGMLGAQWVESEDMSKSAHRRRMHERAMSSMTSVSAPLEPIHEDSLACPNSHWEGEPSGSGTAEIIFQLRPLAKCGQCGIKPLQMLYAAGKKMSQHSARTPTALHHARSMYTMPNKSFRLVCNLLSYYDAAAQDTVPDEFFAHFRIVFYLSDGLNYMPSRQAGSPGPATPSSATSFNEQDKGCCGLRRHVFNASIKIGKEGDVKLRQKKEVDFNSALASLEGKKGAATPGRRR